MGKKIVVIDGQGGKIGRALIEKLLQYNERPGQITAIGTNSLATENMLKASPDLAATGENAVIVACRDADVIAGPMGIIVADALLGEITPRMAAAVGASGAKKALVPVEKCGVFVAGTRSMPMSALTDECVREIFSILDKKGEL